MKKIVLLLVVVTLMGAVVGCFGASEVGKPVGYLSSGAVDESGAEIPAGTAIPFGQRLMFASVSPAAYGSPGGVTLVATIEPENATDKTVDWFAEFVSPDASWASGKSVADYITVTPESDGSLNAAVVCLAPFGEQIRIRVKARSGGIEGTCVVDYMPRVQSLTASFSDLVNAGNDFSFVMGGEQNPFFERIEKGENYEKHIYSASGLPLNFFMPDGGELYDNSYWLRTEFQTSVGTIALAFYDVTMDLVPEVAAICSTQGIIINTARHSHLSAAQPYGNLVPYGYSAARWLFSDSVFSDEQRIRLYSVLSAVNAGSLYDGRGAVDIAFVFTAGGLRFEYVIRAPITPDVFAINPAQITLSQQSVVFD